MLKKLLAFGCKEFFLAFKFNPIRNSKRIGLKGFF